jgi:hypothetical protein
MVDMRSATAESVPQRPGRFPQLRKVCRNVRDVFRNCGKCAAMSGTFSATAESVP